MSNFQVDLTNCDIEPIHIPGQIQSHGFMVVIDDEMSIQFHSNNISNFISPVPDLLIGKSIGHIEGLLDEGYQPDFIRQLISSGKVKGFERINPIPITISGIHYYLIISVSNSSYILEFELSASSFQLDVQGLMGNTIAEILTYSKLEELLENTAIQVKQVIDFDRVMIYRFARDGHGEVVAESKNEDLSPWLGLHYPASDIPRQARELYKLNLTRLIADVESHPARINKAKNNPQDLDLTFSQLRAVSPIHIQYLKNMGVASSFSISLKFKDELWGLIACHNYTQRFIDFKSREYAKLIGQITSSALEFRQNEELLRNENEFKNSLEKIIKQLLETESIEKALTSEETTLLDVVKSDGAVLVHDNKIYKLGSTPNDQQLLDLMFWINDQVKDTLYQTDSFSSVYPKAAAYEDSASGILISVLSKELGDYLIWFRAEQVQNVKWAGNPDKPVIMDNNGLLNISPRNSFAIWTETITGVAEGWSIEDIKAVIKLKEEVNYGLNHKAGTARLMNERLKLAYQELESFSYTISHDLKNPIASIKSYAQLLIRDQNILERGQKMLHRIADRADQMNLMINAVLDYSRVGRTAMLFQPIKTENLITEIVNDLQLIYANKNLKIVVGEVPDLQGDPIMVLQVFSNLIGNAVKYSQHSSAPKVHISGELIGNKVHYSIIDNGIGIAQNDLLSIFELFNRMDNVKDIEGSGVGLAIVKRIIEKHEGTIVAESELGVGSTFRLTFNHNEC
ncbi:ATP-binding protein [Pedobacter sp. UYP1]|jgi:chemotaxis family two-component system sensor kinase Cph1|uniref:ATP-binding protein n=1 Tax=Pedobacter sp. UYP1 TaxID=1756396 RepID=UPI003396127B